MRKEWRSFGSAQISPRNLSFSSHADITPSRISGSNLPGGNLDSSSSADHNRPRSLQEYLTGSTLTSIVDKDQSGSPRGGDQITESSNLPISDKSPTVSRALQELMRSEDKVSHAFFFKFLFILLHYEVELSYMRVHVRPLYLLQSVVCTKADPQSHIATCALLTLSSCFSNWPL